MVAEDVPETHERLKEFEKAVEGLEEMIAVVDREYRYVIANRAFLDYRNMRKGGSGGTTGSRNIESGSV